MTEFTGNDTSSAGIDTGNDNLNPNDNPPSPSASGTTEAVDSCTPRPPSPFLVEPILPSGQIHLLSGATGVGKSTLLLQQLHALSCGDPVFGHDTSTPAAYTAPAVLTPASTPPSPLPPPLPPPPPAILYVSCSRSRSSILETLRRVSIPVDLFPVISAFDEDIDTMDALSARIRGEYSPSPADIASGRSLLIVLDGGIARFVPGSCNSDSSVAAWFSTTRRQLIDPIPGATVIAVTCAAKAKEGELYLSPRQRIKGSSMWGEMASTVVVVEDTHPANPCDPNRVVYILPPNHAAERINYLLDRDGRFQSVSMSGLRVSSEGAAIALETETLQSFRLLITVRDSRDILTAQEVYDICDTLAITRRTGYRYLQEMIDRGQVIRVANGAYRVRQN